MLEYIKSILQQNQVLEAANPVIVGVSGGADSLILLDALHRLGQPPLVVMHINHGLRPEAGSDAQHVAAAAGERGLPFVLAEVDVRSYARQHALSIEEAARTLRYRELFAEAGRRQAQAVAVAHTADDQVETVLMHFLRGAGLAGLKGMPVRLLPNPWSDSLPLLRPLLGIWRADVLAYCRQQGLQPVDDSTNLDTTYHRNRLRHELLPELESYNPKVRGAIWRTSEVLAGDWEVVEQAVDQAWQVCAAGQGAGYVAFWRPQLAGQLLGVQRGLLRRALACLRPGLRDINLDVVSQALQFARSERTTGSRDLAAGLRLLLEGERMWLAAWEADLPSAGWPQLEPGCLPVALPLPGRAALPGGWRLETSLQPAGPAAYQHVAGNPDPYQAWIDPASLKGDLQVRCRRPGDRFRPLGMPGGTARLSDVLINMKMPRRARARWPLVAAGAEIVWLPGYQLAHPYRLKPDSPQAAHLRLLGPGSEGHPEGPDI